MAMIDENIGKAWSAAITIVAAGAMWMVRTVVTNNSRLAMLEQKIDSNNENISEKLNELKEFNDKRQTTQDEILSALKEIKHDND